jgi:cardiolipin synthase
LLDPEGRLLIEDPRLFRDGNRVHLLTDAEGKVGRMVRAIGGARLGVFVEMYIFDQDDVGREFATALKERARAGVPVRLIYDSLGSRDTEDAFFDDMRKDGVGLLEFHPVRLLAPGRITLRRRNHRKLVIVDGRTAFVGSMNFTRGQPESSGPAFLDATVEVEGPVVMDLVRMFGRTWKKERGRNPVRRRFPEPPSFPDGIPAAAFGSERWHARRSVGRSFLRAVARSRLRVWISNAYLIPTGRFLRALVGAAARGVDVRIVVPAEPDVPAVFHATRAYFDQLLRAGVRLYERRRALMHAKTAVIDGVWSTVGSYNLDHLSLFHNLELTMIAVDRGFAREMEADFERHLAESTEVRLDEWARRGLGRRALESLFYWLRPLL